MKALLCREFGPLEGLALEDASSPIARNGQMVLPSSCGRDLPDTLVEGRSRRHQYGPYPLQRRRAGDD